MCQCTPNIRTPFCGKGDCQWNEKPECPFHDQDGIDVCTCEKEWWDDPKYTKKAHPSEKFCSHDYREAEMHWDIPMILSKHRKRVVREIREAMVETKQAKESPWVIEAILSLPELKENK